MTWFNKRIRCHLLALILLLGGCTPMTAENKNSSAANAAASVGRSDRANRSDQPDRADRSQSSRADANSLRPLVLRWDPIPGAAYRLSLMMKRGKAVKLAGGGRTDWIENAVDETLLAGRTSWDFDGACPSRKDLDAVPLDDVEKIELRAAVGGRWDDEEALHFCVMDVAESTVVESAIAKSFNTALAGSAPNAYAILAAGSPSGPSGSFSSSSDSPDPAAPRELWFRFPILLTWTAMPDAAIRLDVRLRDGRWVVGHATLHDAAHRNWFVFDGVAPLPMATLPLPPPPPIPLADVAGFRLTAFHADGESTTHRVGRAVIRVPAEADEPPHVLDHAEASFDPPRRHLSFDFATSPRHGIPTRLLVPHMADPALIEYRGRFILCGTNEPDTRAFVFRAADASGGRTPLTAEFAVAGEFRPNDPANPAHDPAHRYFHLWAPDLFVKDGRLHLIFSARRVDCAPENPEPKGAPADGELTIFVAELLDDVSASAPGDASPAAVQSSAHSAPPLRFGPPRPFDTGIPGLPRHSLDFTGEDALGSPDKMKIDPAVFIERDASDDEIAHWAYVWFKDGNHVASFQTGGESRGPGAAAPAILRHVDPTSPDEEAICEAPAILRRGDFLYFFYSSGFFNSRYKIEYMMGRQFEDLVKGEAPEHVLSSPPWRPRANADALGVDPNQFPGERWRYGDRKLLRNGGHCAVVEHGGRYYIAYHVGQFRDGLFRHDLGRDTVVTELTFRADGTIVPLE